MPIASLETLDSLRLQPPSACNEGAADPANAVGELVCQALLKEVELTPKPGLVDRRNSGAHRDMDVTTFHASVEAIAPWFPIFHRIGAATRHLSPEALLAHLRPAGRACEEAMLRATGGVNTHKGSVFSMGLLCAAAGRLRDAGALPDRDTLCAEVARISSRLVETELVRIQNPRTAGEKLFQAHGLTGVRGEAASGFRTVRTFALPAYEGILALGSSEEQALLEALLHLLSVNPDTNLVHRGGLAGLAHVQARAASLLDLGGVLAPGFLAHMLDFDADLIQRNLSPGGSADLLAVTWFLSRLPGSVLALAAAPLG
jgi:triphosphoribosyl-dephospho-CoA synthase